MSDNSIDKEKLTLEKIIFNLVLHGGNARGKAYDALDAAEIGDFEAAKKCLEEADDEFYKGHNYQNLLIQGQMENETPNFLVIHAQDQLMTALSEKNLIKREITLYKKVAELEKKVDNLSK
ncbi:PTS system cellobiose-specific IIA component [Clostridium algifaecis]|uniref:PTS system cellobiose-specific IIA component n=1 Tax=Clostridium algifaecis TaxID=1472040 RepID=A0ABS4KU71_9CLOT|nr:PTS lactose/cellobiose transporter subunit IIA [Clostridium algifaecis]MBP2033562.1 PTS system cellobiose-specific IIA component [Clostridium algifaecis]